MAAPGDLVVAVASGKGGTGKTTVAVNLARVAGQGVQLLDCDVEAPNAHLFVAAPPIAAEPVTIPVPVVDAERCDGCGACSRFCEFHAIVSFGTAPLVFPEMCHGCGGCTLVCPRGAIAETGHRIGVVETFRGHGLQLVHGRLDVGTPTVPPLIRAVKKRRRRGTTVIVDAPPGTSCPVVTTLTGASFVVLVTEPTPFGLHDLELALAVVEELGLPCGVVLNRADVGDDRTRRHCEAHGVPVLLEIPEDRRIAEVTSRGELVVEALPGYRSAFELLLSRIRRAWRETGARPEGSLQP